MNYTHKNHAKREKIPFFRKKSKKKAQNIWYIKKKL